MEKEPEKQSQLWEEHVPAMKQGYHRELLKKAYESGPGNVKIFPLREDVFASMRLTSLNNTKVVIVGQDPYFNEHPGKGPEAHGLCFSVLSGTKLPPSLVNIYKELKTDIPGFIPPKHGNLQAWAEQGVLLLNTVLTVEEAKAHSHKSLGWEQYTDKVIELIDKHLEGVVFILWGAHAKKKGKSIDKEKHHVQSGPHPSPLSAYRGFFGCKHFSKTNELLTLDGKTPIDWQV